MMMNLSICPKCKFELPAPAASCPRCGIIFDKWKPQVWKGEYEYKMVQIAQNLILKAETAQGNEAALYLESIVNEMSSLGWEFYRIDQMYMTFSHKELFNTRSEGTPHSFGVITFRRRREP